MVVESGTNAFIALLFARFLGSVPGWRRVGGSVEAGGRYAHNPKRVVARIESTKL